MLSIMKEEFDELLKKKYKKIMKNKFYNSFLLDAYRENSKSS